MPIVVGRRRRPARVGSVNLVQTSDVQALQKTVLREVTELDAAVLACLMKLDQVVIDQWHTDKNAAMQWAGQEPHWYTGKNAAAYTQGQSIEVGLRGWYDRLRTAGCGASVPATPAAPPLPAWSTGNPGTFMGTIGDIANLLPFVLIFLVARELRA
jgi:hypothetical protein